MRPLLCLIFFRSFGSLPPPCCDRTVRNSDAHALCRRRDKASPVGVRYSGRSRGLSHLRQVVPYRRSLFRRSAMNCLSPYATLRFAPYESGHKHQRFKLGLKRSENWSLAQVPLPFFGSPYAIAFRSVYVTGERNSDAIAPRYSRISPSPIGNRYSGRSRDLSHLRQVIPYRRSLFRRSAMNCLSPYASLFTSCVKCIRSLRLPLAATFAKLLQALSRRRQLRSEAPVTKRAKSSRLRPLCEIFNFLFS